MKTSKDYFFNLQNPKYSLEESSSLTKTSTTFHVNKETHKRKCSDSLKSIEWVAKIQFIKYLFQYKFYLQTSGINRYWQPGPQVE